MASYNYYLQEYDKLNKSNYNKQVQNVKDLANSTLTGTLNLIDQNTQASTKPLEQQKKVLPQQYQSYFDANEVQYLVNQRQLEERMANLGLTNSGLNRTQETALAVQKSNTEAAYNQKKQAAILSLDNQINELIASGNLKKQEATLNSQSALQSNLLSLENDYATSRSNYASSMEQADKQAAAEAEAARIKAEQESQRKYEEWALENGVLTYDNSGKLVPTNDNTPNKNALAPTTDMLKNAYVMRIAKGKDAVLDYIESLEDQGYNGALLAQQLDNIIGSDTNRRLGWNMSKNGGWYSGSLNDNTEISDNYGYGVKFTIAELYKALKAQGMDDKAAKEFAKTMQTWG